MTAARSIRASSLVESRPIASSGSPLLFAAYFSQPLLLLVAAGAVFRAFAKDVSAEACPGYGVTLYFIVLLAVLGYLSTLTQLGVPPR